MKKSFEKRDSASQGFTLIEVLVAVLIITVVIAALLQLFSNNTTLLGSLSGRIGLSTQGSLFLGFTDVGFEKKTIKLDELLKEFEPDDELRRRLKELEVEVNYVEIKRIDTADFQDEIDEMADANDESSSVKETATPSLEIGRTTIEINGVTTSFLRLRLQ